MELTQSFFMLGYRQQTTIWTGQLSLLSRRSSRMIVSVTDSMSRQMGSQAHLHDETQRKNNTSLGTMTVKIYGCQARTSLETEPDLDDFNRLQG